MIGMFEKNKIALNTVNYKLTSTFVSWQRFVSFLSNDFIVSSNVLSVSKGIILYQFIQQKMVWVIETDTCKTKLPTISPQHITFLKYQVNYPVPF